MKTTTALNYLDFNPILIDCQTSGGQVACDRIIEFAWGKPGLKTKAISVLSKLARGEELAPQISRITGIYGEDLVDGLSQKKLFDYISKLIRDQKKSSSKPLIFVAHFASFERRFLDELWRRNGRKNGFPIRIVCTHLLAKRLVPGLTSYSLRAVAGFLHAPLAELKRATTHVQATREVWVGLLTNADSATASVSIKMLDEILDRKPSKLTKSDPSLLVERAKRLKLPTKPGVYFFLGRDKRILYVGKAKNLKSRVNSHFTSRGTSTSLKKEMLAQVDDIDFKVYATEFEAIVEELRFIQELDPPYNRAHRSSYEEFYLDRNLVSIANPSDGKMGGAFKVGTSLEYLDELTHAIRDSEPMEIRGEEVSKAAWKKGATVFLSSLGIDRRGLSQKRPLMARLIWSARQEGWERSQSVEDSEGKVSQAEVSDWLKKIFREIAREYILGRLAGRCKNCIVEIGRGAESPWVLEISSGRVILSCSGKSRASNLKLTSDHQRKIAFTSNPAAERLIALLVLSNRSRCRLSWF